MGHVTFMLKGTGIQRWVSRPKATKILRECGVVLAHHLFLGIRVTRVTSVPKGILGDPDVSL